MADLSFVDGTLRPYIDIGATFLQRLVLFVFSQFASASVLHVLTKRSVPGGQIRLLAASFCAFTNALTPLFFDPRKEIITLALVTFNTMWLTTFKIALWAVGRSSLADGKASSLQFAAMLLLPLTPLADAPRRWKNGDPKEGMVEHVPARILALKAVIKGLAIVVLLLLVLPDAERLPPLIRSFVYGLGLYTMLSSVMDGPGAAISSFLDIPVSPHFHSPWFSSSVASFWNQRWDLAAGNALRALVYEPCMEGSLVCKNGRKMLGKVGSGEERINQKQQYDISIGKLEVERLHDTKRAGSDHQEDRLFHRRHREVDQGAHTSSRQAESDLSDAMLLKSPIIQRPRRQFIALSASFITSGIIHEIMHWYFTGTRSGPRWPWMCFFLLQIPIIVVERLVLGLLRQKQIVVPKFVLISYTVCTVAYLTSKFFWAPVEEPPFILQRTIKSADDMLRAILWHQKS